MAHYTNFHDASPSVPTLPIGCKVDTEYGSGRVRVRIRIRVVESELG